MAGAMKNFDVVELYEPDKAHVRKWIHIPRKVVYINRAAAPDAKVIKICFDDDDILEMLMDVD